MKVRKKILAFILTTVIVISGSGGFLTVDAATGALNDKIEVSMEDGIKMTSSLSCSGEPEEFTNTTLFADHISRSTLLGITIRFKVTDPGSTNFISLLEICDKSDNSSASDLVQSSLAVIVSKAGDVYWEAGSAKAGTDWMNSTGVNIADGQYHTLQISVTSNSFKCRMDNAAEKETTAEGTRKTKDYMKAFFGGTAAGYTDWRKALDAVVIGGLSGDSYFKHPNYANLKGEISELKIQGGLAPDSQTGSGFASGMFSAAADNTWLFGGGVETQGRFSEIGGVRNYVGQFEEYVRWLVSGGTSDSPLPMQRYMINAGKEGCDAVQFADDLEKYIERTDPKAVSYFIGPEDYCKGEEGIEAFKTAVSSIIQTSLGMKGGNGGYFVLQLPHAVTDAEMSENVSAYAAAAREVYNEAASDEEKADRMALVDHLAATQEESFKTENLTGDLLNAKGHLEIARQFAQTVKGSTNNFPAITKSWTAEETPGVYRKEIPEAVVSQNNLNVTVPDEIKASSFEYRLTVLGTTISGTAYQNPFVIKDLPAEEEYELLVLCKDENTVTQLSPVEGVVTDQNTAKKPEITGELAKAIRQKAEGEEPLTWLFMGDSITHGAQHTGGYDSIAQLFEKYLKEDLGRTDDIVVNTAVSGATTATSGGRGTLTHMEHRMAKYKPDIVSVMLGTNDTINDDYNANLKQIADEIRKVNKDAIIIFRAPSPAGRTYAGKLPGENGSVARMKKVADENGILFIDQYTDWNKELDAYSYLYNADHYFGDGYLHPGGAGHVRMTTQFIRECGLDTNTRIANLSYQFAYTDETSDNVILPAIEPTAEKDGVTISKTALQTVYGNGTIGDMTVVLTDADGKTYTKELGLDDTEAVIKLPKNRRYTVNVTAMPKGSAAKRVAFAEQEVLLGDVSENAADQKAADDVIEMIRGIGDVTGTLSPATKQEIKRAREAYEALTDQQKLLVANELILRLLADAEEAVDSQEAEAVKDQIKDLENISEETITEAEAEEIKSVLAAYQELTDRQKSFISAALKEQLAKAEEVLNQKEEADKKAADQRAADSAVAKIQAIGSVSGTAECKKKIDDARAAYNALTDEQKQLVPENIEKLLTDAEALYIKLINTKPEQKFEIGKTYEDKNYLYRITGDSTAEAAGIKADTEKTITIPDTVSFGGKTYQVTSIQDSVFSKKTAAGAVIGKNVEIIGKNAFAGCKKLKKVTIKSTRLKEIGSKAFSNCKALKNITIKSKVLKKAGKNCLKGIHKKAVIKVPSSKYKDYVKRLAKKGQSKTVKIKK